MKRSKTLYVPLYHQKLVIIVSDDFNKVLKEIDPENKSNYSDNAGFVLVCGRVINIVINPDVEIDVVAHESFHAVIRILNQVGLEFHYKGEEAFAYLLGWVTYEVDKFMKKCNKK